MKCFSRRGPKKWMQCIALIVCQSLLLNNNSTLFAQPDDQIRINRRYGRVINSYQAPDSTLKVIHVQDAHCVEEVQFNIARILRDVVNDYNLKLIGLEGAAGTFDTGRIRTFPDKQILQNVSSHFVKAGKLSGAEYYSINNSDVDDLLGIEDAELYRKNYDSLVGCLQVRQTAHDYFDSIAQDLALVKKKFLSPELYSFIETANLEQNEKNNFIGFCAVLHETAESLGLDLSSYKNFTRFVATANIEALIDFEQVNNEKSSLLDALNRALPRDQVAVLLQQNLYFRINKISAREYYDCINQFAQQVKLNLDQYPNFSAYTRYLTNYDAIDQKKLFSEADSIFAAIQDHLSVTDDDKVITRLLRANKLLKKYSTLQLSTDELERLDQSHSMSFAQFSDTFALYQHRLGSAPIDSSLEQAMRAGMARLKDFYDVARARDISMVERLLAEMELEGVDTAVLIAGGFHTEGILHQLREKGVSYDVVIPEITKQQEKNPYFNLISNTQTEFEQQLARNTLQLALRTANLDLLNRDDQIVFAKELDLFLTVFAADAPFARAMTETEMIEHVNRVLSKYDNRSNVRVLARVRISGQNAYRGYLVQVGDQEFTFRVADTTTTDFTGLDQAIIGDQSVYVFDAAVFQNMLAENSRFAQMDMYSVALSAEYRHRLAASLMNEFLTSLQEMGELTGDEIAEKAEQFGVDVIPSVHNILDAFVKSGLIKLVKADDVSVELSLDDLATTQDYMYTWYAPTGPRNLDAIQASLDHMSGVPGGVYTKNEIGFSKGFIDTHNADTTGNIKLFYVESGIPIDIQYRVLSELYAGRRDLFRKSEPNSLTMRALDGDTYEIRVVYRSEDNGFFFRVGLKEAQAERIAQRVALGKAIVESPVVSLQSKGIKVTSSNPLEQQVVGVPKFSFEIDSSTGQRIISATVFEIDKASRSLQGILEEVSTRRVLAADADVAEEVKNLLATVLRTAEQQQIGLIEPILDTSLRYMLDSEGVDFSLLMSSIDYAEVPLAVDIIAEDGSEQTTLHFESISSAPLAIEEIRSIMYDILGVAEVDALFAKDDGNGLIKAFYETTLPMARQALKTILAQYNLSGRTVELDINLAPGALAEAHTAEVDKIKIVINAHVFRSPGLLFAQLEHEVRHHFVKPIIKEELIAKFEENLKKTLPPNTDASALNNMAGAQVSPVMIDFIAELYVSLKELERYDSFGLDPALGVSTINVLRSPGNPIDPDGTFINILETVGDERLQQLITLVAQRYFPDTQEGLPAEQIIRDVLAALNTRLQRTGMNGDYQIAIDPAGAFVVWTQENQQVVHERIEQLVGAHVPFPNTVKISQGTQIGERVSISSDVSVLGRNIRIGNKVDIGKGVRIISDGGHINIADGATLRPGTIIHARSGDVITIGPGTIIQNSTITGSVTVRTGALILNSDIKNAVIESAYDAVTQVEGSSIWGERSSDTDMVIIRPGVSITYSKIKTLQHKVKANLIENVDEMLSNVLDPSKYVVAPAQTIIDSGTKIEKAQVTNTVIGKNVTIREHARIIDSIINDQSLVRINAEINLTYMGRSTEVGSKVSLCYFGDGSKSEHQGSELEQLILPNEYLIVDANGQYKKIEVPNTTNIGAGTILKNETGRPVIMYHGFTGINSHLIAPQDQSTIIFPFTLTKGTTGGAILPFAYSDQMGVYNNAWMLNSYIGALINHFLKTKSAVKKLGYPMDDFDQLFSGTLRLALKLIDEQIASLSTDIPLSQSASQLKNLQAARATIQANLYSGAWDIAGGVFNNGMFTWRPGDKWSTDILEQFKAMNPDQLDELSELYQFFKEHLQTPPNYQPQEFSGLAKMGTDGMRGKAQNEPIIDNQHVTPAIGYRLGIVSALYAAVNGKNAVYIGGDTRPSRDYLIPAVVLGARHLGVNVKHEEQFKDHTPGAQYKVMNDPDVGGGVVVTASHNVHYDNGFKLLDVNGAKISAEWEAIANRIVNARDLPLVLAQIVSELGGKDNFSAIINSLTQDQVGDEQGWDDSLDQRYLGEVVEAMNVLLPSSSEERVFRIDTAAGAGVRILEALQQRQAEIPNFKLDLINTEGTINDRVGAEYIHKELNIDIASGKGLPQWIDERKGQVIATLDGDADRNLLFRVNESGELEIIDGDKFAALKVKVLTKYLQEAGLSDRFQVGVAQTVLANMGSKWFTEHYNIPAMETKVGDKYVREAANQWAFGSTDSQAPAHGIAVYYEAAGHGSIIFSDEFIQAVQEAPESEAKKVLNAIITIQNMAGGDGIRNLLLFYALMQHEGLSFDKLNDSASLYPEIPKVELEMKVLYKDNVTSVDDLGKEVTGPEDIKTLIDDWKDRLGDEYRIIVRASGTSPKVRVQVDGPDEARIQEAAYTIMQGLYDSPNIVGHESETPPIEKYRAILAYQKQQEQKRKQGAFREQNYDAILQAVRAAFVEDFRYAPSAIEGRAEVGTDGIRGKASPEIRIDSSHITPPVAYRMGITTGLKALAADKNIVHVSADTRPSKKYLMDAFIAGVQQMGIQVVVNGPEGVASTPQLQLFVRVDQNAGAGGVISASHNPTVDNGIKLVDETGGKISADWEAITNDLVNSADLAASVAEVLVQFTTNGEPDRSKINRSLDVIGSILPVQDNPDAQIAKLEADLSYVDRIVEAMVKLQGLSNVDQADLEHSLVVDAAAGAGTVALQQIAERINALKEQGTLNIEMQIINTDGIINEHTGAEYIHKELRPDLASDEGAPEWINAYRDREVGSVDGDADRNLMFRLNSDDTLQVIDGDKFAALKAMVLKKYLAQLGLSEKFNVGVAQTVLANLGSKGFFNRIGVPVMETKVGDKYVRQAALDWMQGNGIAVYYEAAGHGSIVFSDDFRQTVERLQPANDEQSKAKQIIENIMALQNEAGGDGIMNLLLFKMLMIVEGFDFDQLNDDNFLYRDLPKTELQLKVKHKENVTSKGDLGKELTGPSDLVAFIDQVKEQLQGELEQRIDSGELKDAELPVKEFRIIVRASGTSPQMRVQVDGPVADMTERAAYLIMQFIYDSPNIVGVETEPRPMDKYEQIVAKGQQALLASLTVTMEDGAKYIYGWSALTEKEQLDILIDLTKNGLTSETLQYMIDVHQRGGDTAVVPPTGRPQYNKPVMKDISRSNPRDRVEAIRLGTNKSTVDRSALVVMAGGDGSRLLGQLGFREDEMGQWSKPTIPVTMVTQKPPLQLILENMARIRKDEQSDIPIVIVVGPVSRKPIEQFLAQHNNFGIDNIVLVEQSKWPVVKTISDELGSKMLMTPDKGIEYNPNGTGGIVDALGKAVTVNGNNYASVVDYLDGINRDKLVFWQGDVGGFTPDLFFGILGVSKGISGAEDIDIVGLTYASPNRSLGTVVAVDGKILIIESGDRRKFPGLDEADDVSDGNVGLPRNSGGYLISLKAVQKLIGSFPAHLQPNKGVNAFDLIRGQHITTCDKLEFFLPDLFPLLAGDPDITTIVGLADEGDMVPQKSPQQLRMAAQKLVIRDQEILRQRFPETSLAEDAYIEISPLFEGSVGTKVHFGAKSELYLGQNVSIGESTVIGNNVVIKGEHISIGRNVRITDGSVIIVEGAGKIVIDDDVVIDSNVRIHVRDGETVTIGKGAQLVEGTTILGITEIGDNVSLRAALIEFAAIGNNSTIEESTVRGFAPEKIVKIGENVRISDQSILTTSIKTKSWSFLEEKDLDSDFAPTDEFVLRQYRVSNDRTEIGNGTIIRGARLTNTRIGEKTVVEKGAAAEHSIIGDNSRIEGTANITISALGNNVIVGSEVSKSVPGDGFITEANISYISTISPNEFVLADENGNLFVLPLPNPTYIGDRVVFANYGGKPAPDMDGSLKGTSFLYAATIDNANVVNLYDHPDIASKDLIDQRGVTVIYPFAVVPHGEVWGTVYPFSEATTLSTSGHRIGAVLDDYPETIVEKVRRIYDILPADRKADARKVVIGSLWLGVKMVKDEMAVVQAKLDANPNDRKSSDRMAQLQEGLNTYMRHIESGQWNDPLGVNLSGIVMSNYDETRETIDFVKVLGNRSLISIQNNIIGQVVANEQAVAEMQNILPDLQPDMTEWEQARYQHAVGLNGSVTAQMELFIDIARDRLQQVRDVLVSQYHGVSDLTFVVALGTERLAERHIGGDKRIVLNAHALRSKFLLFAEAEHELYHEFSDALINQHVENSALMKKGIVASINVEYLTKLGTAEEAIPAEAEMLTRLFFEKLQEFLKEEYVIMSELELINAMSKGNVEQLLQILRDPNNPIDRDGAFADLIQATHRASPDVRRQQIQKYILDNYEGMDIVKDMLEELRGLRSIVQDIDDAPVDTRDFALLHQIEHGTNPDGTFFGGLMSDGSSPYYENVGESHLKHGYFTPAVDESNRLVAVYIDDDEGEDLIDIPAADLYDVSVIDFDIFGDSMLTDSNSLFITDTIERLKTTAQKKGCISSIVMFSLTKDAAVMRDYFTQKGVNMDDITIIDRNDIIAQANAAIVKNAVYQPIFDLLSDAKNTGSYTRLDTIFDEINEGALRSKETAALIMNVIFHEITTRVSLNLSGLKRSDMKVALHRPGMVTIAVESDIRTISWDVMGQGLVNEGDLLAVGMDNLLLLEILEPGSEIPAELIVTAVAPHKTINGVNVYDVFTAEQQRRKSEAIDEPITIQFLVYKIGVSSLQKADLKGIAVSAPKRRIDKEFQFKLQQQRLFDEAA